MGQKARAALVAACVACAFPCVAPPAAAFDINRSAQAGEAIEGFDPVAYFTTGVPKQGSRAYLFEWQGAVWRFANQADLDLFKANPDRYAPVFGGYCAYAMSKGIEAGIHPFAFAIEDGHLYLFSTFESRDRFLANSDVLRGAEENWSLRTKQSSL